MSNSDPDELRAILDEYSPEVEAPEVEPIPQPEPVPGDLASEITVEDEASTESARSEGVLRLVPSYRTGPNARDVKHYMGTPRGRPRKIDKPPTANALRYHAEMSAEKAKFVDVDPVVSAARNRADSAEVLKLIKTEIAKESAALHFQRIENEKYGKDTQQVSTRRIDALTKIAHIELEIKKLGADLLDLKSEKVQRIFALWIEMIKEVASETLPPEQIDLFFTRLTAAIDGWEEKATDLIR